MSEAAILSQGPASAPGARAISRVADILALRDSTTPDAPALIEGGETWTYRTLARASAQLRHALVGHGLRPGDRIVIVGENGRALVAAFMASAGLDAWPAIVNPRLSEREVDLIHAHARPRFALYCVAGSARARLHATRAGAVPLPGVEPGLLVGGPDPAAEAEPVESDPAARVAALVYTSGTTGLPKGVMLTNANLLFTAEVSGRLRGFGPGDQVYAVLPFSHSLGLAGVLLGTMFHGGTVRLATRFDPALTMAALRGGLTVLLGTPTMFALMLEYARAKGLDSLAPHALRLISSAGAPLDSGVKAAVEHLFGLPLYNGYGVTECSPTVSQTWLNEARGDTSVGRVLPGVSVRLTGADGNPAAPGAVGELHVRGPNVMRGYFRDPVASDAAVDAAGWFHTGDLARLDDQHLFIVGRAKELIIRFGFNVYPPEIEAVLNAHPSVMLSAVLGRPVRGDDEIVAFVQLSPGSTTTTQDLAEHAARLLAPYKQPTEIRLVDTMPTSAPGKIRKVELIDWAVPPATGPGATERDGVQR